MEKIICVFVFRLVDLTGRYHLEDKDIDDRIMLKLMSGK
jgi:hypothetical protein